MVASKKIQFTDVAEPTLPDFQQQSNLPVVKPDWSLLAKHDQVISRLKLAEDSKSIQVLQIRGNKEDRWQLKLVGINTTTPIAHADVLVSAFRRQAVAKLIDKQTECTESLTAEAGYQFIAIDMLCSNFVDSDAKLLGQFWRKDFADKLDVDTIRRNLKLNRKIQSVTGSDINRVFEQHLLGKKHPYLKVAQDRNYFDDLSKKKLQRLQSTTASQLQWFLLVKAPETLTSTRLKKLARLVTGQMNVEKHVTKPISLSELAPIKQSRTIYFIDAPDSSDLKVRIGVRFPQYFENGKPVAKNDASWKKQQQSLFACQTLSGILGRGSYGRLFYDLRETRGLTYGAYAYCRNQTLLKAMVLWGSASQERSGAFLEGMLRHLELLKHQATQEAEVDAIKLYFLGQDLISDDYDDGMGVYQLLEPDSEFAKLQRLNWLRESSPAELQDLAMRYLSGTPLVVVRGNADVVLDDLKQKLPNWNIKIVEQE